MLKYCGALLLLGVLSCFISAFCNSNFMAAENTEEFNILNRVLVFLLEKCDLKIQNIVIIDYTVNGSSTFRAVSKLKRLMSISLVSDWYKLHERGLYKDIVQVDGIILVLDTNDDWEWLALHLVNKWAYKRNCIIFILPKPYFACSRVLSILLSMKHLYVPAMHFICLAKQLQPVIYAFNPFGDTKPHLWKKIDQPSRKGPNWALYYRFSNKDSTDICENFYFEREYPKNETHMLVGIPNIYVNNVTNFNDRKVYGEEVELYFKPFIQPRVNQLKKLLKIKFFYYLLRSSNSLKFAFQAYDSVPVDAMMFFQILMSSKVEWQFFFPVAYNDYLILSHNQGLKTPLEKIANFYGLWTLIFLILISTVVLIAVWYKTNKSISSAVFDVIRLLINSGVAVPIDTLSFRIFFCMIFLFFLVIHATFSGHLAEFLTKSEFRKNVQSLEDLKHPRIETIYNTGFSYQYMDDIENLYNKTVYVDISDHCPKFMQANLNSVCVGHASKFYQFRFLRKDWENKFYISKKVLRSTTSTYVYRPRFSLREKINWGMMYLFEIKVFNRMLDEQVVETATSLEKQLKVSEINFRSITINDLKFALILLLIGNNLGLICFLCELCVGWYRKKSKM